MKPLHVLVLDRDPIGARSWWPCSGEPNIRSWPPPTVAAAADALATAEFDAVLVDLGLPGLDVGALRRALSPAEAAEPDSLEAAERRHLALVLRYTVGQQAEGCPSARDLAIHSAEQGAEVPAGGELNCAVCVRTLRIIPLSRSGALLWESAVRPARSIPNGRIASGTLSFDGHATAGDFVGNTSAVLDR